MAVFEYKGFNTEGKTVVGIIDADNPKTARVKLRKSGVYPTEVLEGGSPGKFDSRSSTTNLKGFRWGERVGLLDLSVATRQLATLLAANLPLMEALNALVDQVDHKDLKKVIASIREQVREGSSLAAALNHHPRVFSDVYINMVHAGETSGSLDGMLLRLADFLEHQVKLRNRLIATFTYPIFMLVIGSIILFGLVTFVVPKVTAIFEEMHQALPLPTVLLINVSHFLSNYWWFLLLLVLVSAVTIERYVKTSKGRTQYDHLLMRLPLLGRVTLLVALSRFTRTLSTLLMSGVSLLTALDVVKKAEPLRKSGLFPPLITHMIAIGEKSGELEPMLIKVSEAYDNEVETTITTFTALLGPVMILLMGVMILFIVMAVLLPIFELSQVVR
jgi:general secretion pathway protein F